jgi:uroporphyrinogen-III synthase
MRIADELGLRGELLDAARRVLVASIGPICSEALRSLSLPVDLEPDHPKMGQLVAAVARRAPALLAAKRERAS